MIFLLETAELEARHLLETDMCLIAVPFNVERATALRVDIDQAECTDAFAARFGRLQDTVADKLLPGFLRCLAKPVGAAIDNLDRAEKLGLLDSADDWRRRASCAIEWFAGCTGTSATPTSGRMSSTADTPW